MNMAGSNTNHALNTPGVLTDCDRLVAEIDEPLRRSAPINFRNASELCERHAGPDSCYCYHSVWQYLRLADVARAVRVDGPLFVDAAERFAHAGCLDHVLISGTADYSMLAHLAHGAARAGRPVAFDVLDRCETSLAINSWYANERGLQVRAINGDVLSFQPDRQYDLICTHSFLPWVSDPARLFGHWRSWLVQGGHLCFSNRVSPKVIPYDPVGRTQRTDEIRHQALDRLRELHVPLPCPEPEFVALIQKFGQRRQKDHPELSLETIHRWIGDAGLVLELSIPVADVLPGRVDNSVLSGPIVGRPRTWFQARRT